jgi:hypothetical protein
LDHFASIISGAAVRKAHNYWAERLKGLADREGWSPDAVGTLLLAWPDNRETWTTAAKLGQSVERSYWQRKYPYSPDGDAEDLKFVARQYLSVDRASAAIGALQKNINELPVDLVFDLLDAVIPEVNRRKTPVNNMLVYHLEKIFELLEKKKDVAAEDIARREYAYLPLLKNRKKSLMLHRIMAESPQFYISVISDVFRAHLQRPKNKQKRKERAPARVIACLVHSKQFRAKKMVLLTSLFSEIGFRELGRKLQKQIEHGSSINMSDIS